MFDAILLCATKSTIARYGSIKSSARLSYLYNDWFDAFGVAIISLSIGDGIACIIGSRFGKNSIKLYKEKSLIGTLSGILSTTIVLNLISNIFDMELHIGHILTLAVLTGIVELYSGKYDNIAICFTVFISAYLFMSGSFLENIIISLIVSIASSIIFVNLKLVKKSAATFLMILFFCVIYFGETNIYLSLICTYVPLFIVDKIFDKSIKNVSPLTVNVSTNNVLILRIGNELAYDKKSRLAHGV